MKPAVAVSILLLVAAMPLGAAESKSVQIAAASSAAPEESRDGARVLGYDADGKVTELRAGSNELVCLADKPGDDRYSVACYHEDLEPYMARGRELIDQGVTGAERNEIRWKEIEEGKLAISREPRTLYVMTGDGYDEAAGAVANSYLRWVVYVPFATTESTGLSAKAGSSKPWLMFPGTAGAHIMISPPRND
ncbi:MAG: hypothetical protein AAGK22_10810 [Acidobacteriota bacterium]